MKHDSMTYGDLADLWNVEATSAAKKERLSLAAHDWILSVLNAVHSGKLTSGAVVAREIGALAPADMPPEDLDMMACLATFAAFRRWLDERQPAGGWGMEINTLAYRATVIMGLEVRGLWNTPEADAAIWGVVYGEGAPRAELVCARQETHPDLMIQAYTPSIAKLRGDKVTCPVCGAALLEKN